MAFVETLSSLDALETHLKCAFCHELSRNPCCLGGCEHIFCSTCSGTLRGNSCPLCHIPAHVKDAQVSRQLQNMVLLCGHLRKVLQTDECDLEAVTGIANKQTFCSPEFPKHTLVKSPLASPLVPDLKANCSTLYTFTDSPKTPQDEIVKIQKDRRRLLRSGESTLNVHSVNDSSSQVNASDSGTGLEHIVKRIPGHRRARSKTESLLSKTTLANTEGNQSGKKAGKRTVMSRKPKANLQDDSLNQTTMTQLFDHELSSDDSGTDTNIDADKCSAKKRKSKTTHPCVKNFEGRMNTRVRTRQNSCQSVDNEPLLLDEKTHQSNNTHVVMRNKCSPPKISLVEHITTSVMSVNSHETRSSNLKKRPTKTSTLETHTPDSHYVTHRGRKLRPNSTERRNCLDDKQICQTPKDQGTAPFEQNSGRKIRNCGQKIKLEPSLLSSSPRCSGKQISPRTPKRNAKGETPLQVAAIKGDVAKVRSLLADGADPNVRDNAGWTPLHESCNHGDAVTAELLLDHGAMINIPGMENDSPLHDAVSNYRLNCVRLLVSRGASVSARNLHGQTAFDLAQSEEMRVALETPVQSKLELATSQKAESLDVEEFVQLVFLATALPRDQRIQLQKCASLLQARVVEDFIPEVSHVITSINKDGQCPRTLKYLHAILHGKWIVSMEWISMCMEYSSVIPADGFEIIGCSTHPDTSAPYKGRINRKQQLPGLFDGCQFYLKGSFEYPTPELDDLIQLIKNAGGTILSREPKLHNIDDLAMTVPYHCSPESSLANCGVFIIHDNSATNVLKIRSARLNTAPTSWLMDCIARFMITELPV